MDDGVSSSRVFTGIKSRFDRQWDGEFGHDSGDTTEFAMTTLSQLDSAIGVMNKIIMMQFGKVGFPGDNHRPSESLIAYTEWPFAKHAGLANVLHMKSM